MDIWEIVGVELELEMEVEMKSGNFNCGVWAFRIFQEFRFILKWVVTPKYNEKIGSVRFY